MDTRQIAAEAAEWFFRLERDRRPEDDPEFTAWLKRSPRHMGEFLFVTATHRLIGAADPQRLIPLDEPAAAPSADIAIFGDKASFDARRPAPEQPRRFGGRWKWASAAAVAVALFAWWQVQSSGADNDLYSTRTGEQRSFKLEDGSILHLNTQSRARIAYSAAGREVRLIEGEALFTVAHDSHRPFQVRAGDAVIQVLGTQFNVYLHPESATVSVVEGRVRITSGGTPQTLGAGEEALVSSDRTISRRPVRDLTIATAWRQRRLVFEGTPLSAVAQEFNRYNRPQIRIDGNSAASLQITGVFNADEPQALTGFLAQNPALDIITSADGIAIRMRR